MFLFVYKMCVCARAHAPVVVRPVSCVKEVYSCNAPTVPVSRVSQLHKQQQADLKQSVA